VACGRDSVERGNCQRHNHTNLWVDPFPSAGAMTVLKQGVVRKADGTNARRRMPKG